MFIAFKTRTVCAPRCRSPWAELSEEEWRAKVMQHKAAVEDGGVQLSTLGVFMAFNPGFHGDIHREWE